MTSSVRVSSLAIFPSEDEFNFLIAQKGDKSKEAAYAEISVLTRE
jgi:hypothetical protein